MIKVVSDGPVKTKRVTCHNCGYELEFTGEDVLTTFDSDGDRYQSITCPREHCRERRYRDGSMAPTTIAVKWP